MNSDEWYLYDKMIRYKMGIMLFLEKRFVKQYDKLMIETYKKVFTDIRGKNQILEIIETHQNKIDKILLEADKSLFEKQKKRKWIMNLEKTNFKNSEFLYYKNGDFNLLYGIHKRNFRSIIDYSLFAVWRLNVGSVETENYDMEIQKIKEIHIKKIDNLFKKNEEFLKQKPPKQLRKSRAKTKKIIE